MKVVMTVFDDFSKKNGTTIRAKRILELFENSCDTTVVTCLSNRINEQSEIAVVKVPNARQVMQLPFWWTGLFFSLRKRRFDLIYCSNDWYGFLVGYFFSRVRHCPIIFEAHGILSEEYLELGRPQLSRIFALLEKFVVTHSTGVITLSNRIFKFYSPINKKTVLIPVFVNTEIYKKNLARRAVIRQIYDLSDFKVVGLIGPFDTEWNRYCLDYIYQNIDAFNEKIRFLVIGKCANPLIHKKIVYAGYVQDYVNFLSSLDAVIVPSIISTSGPLNKIIEPMSCSLPVFATPKSLVGLDYAIPGKNILVFDKEILVSEVNEKLFNDILMNNISLNARETVEEFYSHQVHQKGILKFLSSVLGRPFQMHLSE